jgi:hypothetical protein
MYGTILFIYLLSRKKHRLVKAAAQPINTKYAHSNINLANQHPQI